MSIIIYNYNNYNKIMLLPGGFPRGAFIFIIVYGIFNACIPHAAVIIHYQQCVRAVL